MSGTRTQPGLAAGAALALVLTAGCGAGATVPSAIPTAAATTPPITAAPSPSPTPTRAPTAVPTADFTIRDGATFFAAFDTWRKTNRATPTVANLQKELDTYVRSTFAASGDKQVAGVYNALITQHLLPIEFAGLASANKPGHDASEFLGSCDDLVLDMTLANNAGLTPALILAFKVEAVCEKLGPPGFPINAQDYSGIRWNITNTLTVLK